MGDEYPMKRISSTASEIPSKPGSRAGFTRDEAELARFGKKQQLKVSLLSFHRPYRLIMILINVLQRRFGMVSVVGLTCTLMITWEAIVRYVHFSNRDREASTDITS